MKYFVKNKKIKITAIIIFLVLMVSIIDFGFLKSEITNYQMRCHILDNAKSCYVSNPVTYKVSTEQQEVLSWMNIGSGQTTIEKYTDCAIRDRKNWNCKYNDNSGEFGFSGGVYEEYPSYNNGFAVSRLRYLVGYINTYWLGM